MDGNTITWGEALRLYRRDKVRLALMQDRHHHSDEGRIYWLTEDFDEAMELVNIEMKRAEGVVSTPGPEDRNPVTEDSPE